jgi:hypothetical protein
MAWPHAAGLRTRGGMGPTTAGSLGSVGSGGENEPAIEIRSGGRQFSERVSHPVAEGTGFNSTCRALARGDTTAAKIPAPGVAAP